MFPETECGICYRAYNLGRRCPRQLSCKHTFCENCLVTLTRSTGSHEARIACPLCRHSTPVPEEASVHEYLPVDEDAFERLITAGSLEECADDDEDNEETKLNAPSPPEEEVSPPPRSRKGHLMKRIRRLCKKITGPTQTNFLSDADLRDLAMMSCYMM